MYILTYNVIYIYTVEPLGSGFCIMEGFNLTPPPLGQGWCEVNLSPHLRRAKGGARIS